MTIFSAVAWQGHEKPVKLQHACCQCHVAFVRLDRVWVAQLFGGLRVVCGSSCVVCSGLARLSAARLCFDWPVAIANLRAMVCVLAKQQFCDVHLFAVLLASGYLGDERAYLYTLGAHLP